MSVASDYQVSTSSIMEHLLTKHPYRWEIAQLSTQIERLRQMLDEAVEQRIRPEQVYEAVTRGFDEALGVHMSSPSLASDMREGDALTEKELMEALLREVSPA